jgi:hypothetical protein
MSFLFGKKKEIKTCTPVTVIQELKTQLRDHEKREAFTEKNISTLRIEAKAALAACNKSKAIYQLKRVKLLEKELSNIQNMKLNMEIQIMSLEQSVSMQATVSAMKNAKTLGDKQLNPDDISELMDSLDENISMSNEVASTLGRPLGESYDDTDLLNELDEDNKNVIDHAEISIDISKLPSVPTHVKVNNKNVEDDEVKKLQELMI